MITNFIGKTVKFNTTAPAILGASRHNVTIVALLDLDTAMLLSDVRARHAQVKNYLPELPATAGAYSYVKLLYGNGHIEVMGLPWIRTETIEILVSTELFIRVRNTTPSTENTIRQALLQNGIEDFTIGE